MIDVVKLFFLLTFIFALSVASPAGVAHAQSGCDPKISACR